MLSDVTLNLSRKLLIQFLWSPLCIEQECTTINQILNHRILVDVCCTMTCYEVCLVDQVCGTNWAMTETKVRNSYTTGLLRIIVKVSLRVHISVVTDNLDRVLIRTYGTISTKAPELTVCCTLWCGYRILLNLKRQMRYIIDDTDGESLLLSISVNSDDLSRSSILRTKTITTCEYRNLIELRAL